MLYFPSAAGTSNAIAHAMRLRTKWCLITFGDFSAQPMDVVSGLGGVRLSFWLTPASQAGNVGRTQIEVLGWFCRAGRRASRARCCNHLGRASRGAPRRRYHTAPSATKPPKAAPRKGKKNKGVTPCPPRPSPPACPSRSAQARPTTA